jgi:hypothetical protein
MLGGMVAEFGAAGALKQKKKRGKKPSDIANPEEAPVYIFFQLFYFCLNLKEFFFFMFCVSLTPLRVFRNGCREC